MYEPLAFRLPRANLEPRGGKFKFWCQGPDQKLFLFKQGREGTGEDWAEVVSFNIAKLIGFPTAVYLLAEWTDPESGDVRDGVLTEKFLDNEHTLVLGNEILNIQDQSYPMKQVRRVKEHTIGAILALVEHANIRPPIELEVPCDLSAQQVLAGYILFDALISNTDRHHENWGIVITGKDQFYLAPTYDHASSLGRNEPEQRKIERMQTKDHNFSVEKYAEKACSAFYPNKASNKLQTCREAARAASEICDVSFWLKRISDITDFQFRDILNNVPEKFMNDIDREFALRMLLDNQKFLRGLV